MELFEVENEEFEIIKGTRSSFKDYIGGISTGACLKDIVIISDKTAGKYPYIVYKHWLNLNDGIVVCPYPNPAGSDDEQIKYMISNKIPAKTKEFTMPGTKKDITVKVVWRPFCIKSVYKDFGMYK